MEDIEEALKKDPTHGFSWRNKGHAHLGLGEIEEARKVFKEAIERGFNEKCGKFKMQEYLNNLESDLIKFDKYEQITGVKLPDWYKH